MYNVELRRNGGEIAALAEISHHFLHFLEKLDNFESSETNLFFHIKYPLQLHLTLHCNISIISLFKKLYDYNQDTCHTNIIFIFRPYHTTRSEQGDPPLGTSGADGLFQVPAQVPVHSVRTCVHNYRGACASLQGPMSGSTEWMQGAYE